jgi:hypothetical protein
MPTQVLSDVPRRKLDELIAAGNRLCRIVPPYRVLLAHHFTVTCMRIALPEPYPTTP